MLPTFSEQDKTDGRSRHPKPLCEFHSAKPIAEDADLFHGILCQLGVRVLTAARVAWVAQPALKCVLHVLQPAHLLKIAESIVGLDAVDVVSFLARGEGAYKGRKDEAMNTVAYFLALTVKASLGITSAVRVQLENSARPGTTRSPNVPHSAEVRDFVPAFVADDGEPGFLRQRELCRLGVHRKVTPFAAMQPGG